MIGISEVRGKHVWLTDEQSLFLIRQLIPAFQQVVRPRCELRVLRDHAEPFLVGENGFAQFVPTLVEQVHIANFFDPLRRRVMRRADGARHVVDEERLLGIDRGDAPQILDGIVGLCRDQVPTRIIDVGIDRCCVAERIRLPLIGVAAHEPVEVIEAHA